MKFELLNNRYKRLNTVREGGNSAVYHVEDLCSGKAMALKLLLDGGESSREDFAGEFLLMQEIDHPFFPRAHDFGYTPDGMPYFTMDYAPGRDLKAFFSQEDNIKEFPVVLYSVCLALRSLHHRGLLHGDIKPENIKVEGRRENAELLGVRVLDLGLSKPFFRGEERQFSGTVRYLSPEIVLGKDVDQRADIYALGISLYESLTGRLLFTGSKTEVVKKIVSGGIPPLSGVKEALPADIADIVDSMIALRPSDRPVNVEEIIRWLEDRFEVCGSKWGEALLISSPMTDQEDLLADLFTTDGSDGERKGIRIVFLAGGDGTEEVSLMRRLEARLQVMGIRTYRVEGGSQNTPFDAFKRLAQRMDPASFAGEEGSCRLAEVDCEKIEPILSRLTDVVSEGRVALFLNSIDGLDPSSLIAIKLLLIGISHASPLCFLTGVDGKVNTLLDGPEEGETWTSGEGARALLTGMDAVTMSKKKMGVRRLSSLETTVWVEKCLGEVPRGLDGLAGELHRMSAGSPGLMREILFSLITGGVMRFEGGKWDVDVMELKENLELPDVTDSRLAVRTAELNDEEVDLLIHAAVLGHEFEAADVIALKGNRNGHRRILRRLVEKGGYLVEVGEGRFRFDGQALRDHFYRRLNDERKRVLHRRALAVIEKGDREPDPSELAKHFFGAGEEVKGIPHLKEAVRRYRASGKLLEAYSCLVKLGEWAGDTGDEGFWTTRKMGDVLFELRDFSGAIETYRKAVAVIRGVRGLSEKEPEIRLQLARSFIRINALEDADRELMKAGELLRWREDDPLTGKIQREIGWIHFQRGRFKHALRYYRKSLSFCRRGEDSNVLPHLYNDIALLYQSMGKWKKADWWIDRAIELAREQGRSGVVANARNSKGMGFRRRGEYERAKRQYKKALELFREVGDDYGVSQILNNIGELYRKQGDLERAIRYLERSLFIKEFLRNDIGVAYSLSNLGLIHRAAGRLNRSVEFFRRSIEIRTGIGDRDGAGKIYGYLTETLVEAERWEEAKAALDRHREMLDRTESTYGRVNNDYLEGLIALRSGSYSHAIACLAKAVRSFEELGFREEATRARKDAAWALLSVGKVEAAGSEGLKALNESRGLKHRELSIESHLVMARSLELLGEEDQVSNHYLDALQLLEGTIFQPLKAKVMLSYCEYLYKRGSWKHRGKEASEFDKYLREAESLFQTMEAKGKLKAVRTLWRRVMREERKIGGRGLFTLYEAGRVINSSLEIEEVLEKLMALVIRTMDVEQGIIFLKDTVTGELKVEMARNVEKETVEDALSFSSTILNDVQAKGSPIFVPDCREDTVYGDTRSISRYSILSVICVPLRLKGDIIGTIYIDDRRTSHLFDDEDVDFLLALGDMAALAIQNARLYQELEAANSRLREENRDLRRQVRVRGEFHGMIGRHESMQILYQVIEKVAQTDASVLIRGENGSGKELVARAIHYMSKRKEEPFVVVNCAAIPESLLESEIFGIEGGTATGVERRAGKFEQADGGTIFLDEIGDMSPAVQAKFLRVLQEKRFQRVGGKRNIEVDVKILAATNKDLEKAMREDRFREDLYYRLNALPVFVPALRDRVEDIPILVDYFLRNWSEENDRDRPSIDKRVLKAMSEYDWPGNVRQLKNVVERMALMCSGSALSMEDLPTELLLHSAGEKEGDGKMKSLREIQHEYARTVFERCGGNKKKTCEVLGITYKTLQAYLIEK